MKPFRGSITIAWIAENMDQNNISVWVYYTSYNNSLCSLIIIVPELVMHEIELICTSDHLNIKVHWPFVDS